MVVEKVKSIAKENVIILGPVRLPGATPQLSPKKVAGLLDKYYAKTKSAVASKKELSKEESKVKSMPIKMNIAKITPNGKMVINFNQPVVVPFNFIENQGKTKRLLEDDENSDQPISL